MTASNSLSEQSYACAEDAEAAQHLKDAAEQARPWYPALLEAIGLWRSPEEVFRGRRYRYLTGGEAFDWLLLAERLLTEVKNTVPNEQLVDLLFSGKPPVALSKDQFRKIIGASKYKAHLNYIYGVVLEEALLVVVEEEVSKERLTGLPGTDINDEAFLRVYGTNRSELLSRFRNEKSLHAEGSLDLAELHEFTYWLFKYRMATCDPERVASDTKKAMNLLRKVAGESLYI